MRRYVVVFEESAQADVRESYDWVDASGASTRQNNGLSWETNFVKMPPEIPI